MTVQTVHLEVRAEGPGTIGRAYKRAFDVVVGVWLLALAAIPMVLVGLTVKLGDGGPVFYRQVRMTVGGRRFWIWKFRTMRVDAESGGATFSRAGDPRCTNVGRWLRRTGLDELPQLFNVLIGEMSLVGPRPERPEFLEQLTREIPEFPQRLQVKAGMTGLAQVRGFRGDTSFAKRVELDVKYIREWSAWLDLRILLATPAALLRRPKCTSGTIS